MTETLLQKPAHGKLTEAVRVGNMAAVIALLDQGADVNEKNEYDASTPLIEAACKDRAQIIPLLLERGARLEDKDSAGFTALLRAVLYNSDASTLVLIEAGADVNHKNNAESTALIYAARRNRLKTVCKLLEYGAELEMKDAEGNKALEVAQKAQFEEIIQVLEGAPPAEDRLAWKRAEEAAIVAAAATKAAHELAVRRHDLLKSQSSRFKLKVGPKLC